MAGVGVRGRERVGSGRETERGGCGRHKPYNYIHVHCTVYMHIHVYTYNYNTCIIYTYNVECIYMHYEYIHTDPLVAIQL